MDDSGIACLCPMGKFNVACVHIRFICDYGDQRFPVDARMSCMLNTLCHNLFLLLLIFYSWWLPNNSVFEVSTSRRWHIYEFIFCSPPRCIFEREEQGCGWAHWEGWRRWRMEVLQGFESHRLRSHCWCTPYASKVRARWPTRYGSKCPTWGPSRYHKFEWVIFVSIKLNKWFRRAATYKACSPSERVN